jgi:hypothetical protein
MLINKLRTFDSFLNNKSTMMSLILPEDYLQNKLNEKQNLYYGYIVSKVAIKVLLQFECNYGVSN